MEQNNLFIELSGEEAASTTGGGFIETAAYLIVMQSLFPFIAYSPEVLNTALLLLAGVLSFPQNNNTNLNDFSEDN
ncbi:hypothetical protein [Cylindrospermopsis raciborskii]|uniref:hypothetical protein n=1 Tax=Cylindrospermopsis raciborskii TaxID=77022 RepID=UPI000778B0FB|nr:hypothetical protein [Cylindrospermopsis raciborskii]MCZ2207604.1 hypothetical protein [Cylindrospermopsis raciborskii PAMP2011]